MLAAFKMQIWETITVTIPTLTSNLYYKNALDEVPETSTKRVAQLHESMALNHECLGSYDKAKESYLQSLRACRGHPIQELKMVLELAKLADKADEAKEVVVKGFRDALKMASDIPEKPAYKSHVLKYWYEYHKANLDQEESDLVAEELKGHLRCDHYNFCGLLYAFYFFPPIFAYHQQMDLSDC